MTSEPHAPFRQVLCTDADFPPGLRSIPDCPSVLYIQGRWPLPETQLMGIVGTRHPTVYGSRAAERFTLGLVDRGITTVSGLAAGIDACVHRTTLEAGGWTVAVLGHGLGFQYPRENASLFAEIRKKGTLVTEFSYDTGPLPGYFPRRNRIISGLSEGVLVVEAGHRSGALITARFAAEQGRDVYVVPGSIYSGQSAGCHRLIKEGARLVESVEDLLNEDPELLAKREKPRRPAQEEFLTVEEREVLSKLSVIPLSVDELCEVSGLGVDRVAQGLLSLELKGRITHVPGQRYVTNE